MIRHLALALALGAAGLPASAANTLSLEGLDPAKAADVAAFSARLDSAVKAACKGAKVQLDGNRRVTCKDTARSSALAKLPEAWRVALANPPGDIRPWSQADR